MNSKDLISSKTSKVNNASNMTIFHEIIQRLRTPINSKDDNMVKIEEINERSKRFECIKNILNEDDYSVKNKLSKQDKNFQKNISNFININNKVSKRENILEKSFPIRSQKKISNKKLVESEKIFKEGKNKAYKTEVDTHKKDERLSKLFRKSISNDSQGTCDTIRGCSNTKFNLVKNDKSNHKFDNICYSSSSLKKSISEFNMNLNQNKNNDVAQTRRKATSLIDRKHIECFVEKIINEVEAKAKTSLAAKLNINKIIQYESPLIKVLSKCETQMKFSVGLSDLLNREKNENFIKVKGNDYYLCELDKNKKYNINKVFPFDKIKNEILSDNDNDIIKTSNLTKFDRVTKISENLAFKNRNLLFDEFGLFRDPAHDDMIKKKELNEKLMDRKKNKHTLVENYLESANKAKANLINQIDKKLRKLKNIEKIFSSNIDVLKK